MKNKEFVEKAIDIAKNYKTLYVMGCFGAPMNATNKKRYTSNNSYNKKAERTKMIKEATDDTFGFDCVCLIKGILWGWKGDKSKIYGGASYNSNGVADFGTESMKNYCTSWSNDFKSIEIGEVLYMKGHAGIYIGDGLAVECTPAWENKVQITAVKNIGNKSGYNSRKWTSHGKLKYIDYATTENETSKDEEWTVGKYTLLFDKYMRTSTDITKTNLHKYSKLGSVTRKQCVKDKAGYAKFKADPKISITISKIIKKDGRIWGQYAGLEYYVVLCNKDGTPQAKKI